MKTLIVCLVLLATVYCHPVKRSASSSESSEEVVRPARLQLKALAVPPQTAPAQSMTAGSDESSDSSDEAQESDTASDDNADSSDADENDSDESEETTSAPPDPIETTLTPVTDNGRGDNMGYPGDYKKSNIFVESNKIEKGPSPYKFYGYDKAEESMNPLSKKTSINEGKEGNNIEKSLKVYKTLQVHDELVDEDTSTPDVETQGLDSASETAEEPSHRQAEPEAEGIPVESAEEAESASASAESNSSQSSEETTATPGAADSDSSSDESQENESSETEETSEAPIVIIAK